MATKTFEELKQLAIQIRDEKTNKQNTATRIGTQMLEHLNKLEQDYYDKTATDEELKQRDEKLAELSSNTGIRIYNTASFEIKVTAGDIISYIVNSKEEQEKVQIFTLLEKGGTRIEYIANNIQPGETSGSYTATKDAEFIRVQSVSGTDLTNTTAYLYFNNKSAELLCENNEVVKEVGSFKNNIEKAITYNVSYNHPTDGLNGTDNYDLNTAIGVVPVEYRVNGIVISFLNKNDVIENWEKSISGTWRAENFRYIGGNNNETYIDNTEYTVQIPSGISTSSIYLYRIFKKRIVNKNLSLTIDNGIEDNSILPINIYLLNSSGNIKRHILNIKNKINRTILLNEEVDAIRIISTTDTFQNALSVSLKIVDNDIDNSVLERDRKAELLTEKIRADIKSNGLFYLKDLHYGKYIESEAVIYEDFSSLNDGYFCSELIKKDVDSLNIDISLQNTEFTITDIQIVKFDSNYKPISISDGFKFTDLRDCSYYSVQFKLRNDEVGATDIDSANVCLKNAIELSQTDILAKDVKGGNTTIQNNTIDTRKSHVIKITSTAQTKNRFTIKYLDKQDSSVKYSLYIDVNGDSSNNTRRIEQSQFYNIRIETISQYPYKVEIMYAKKFEDTENIPSFTIPYLGCGKVILSRGMDRYCHSPRAVSVGKYLYVIYQSSDWRTTESKDSECTLVILDKVTGEKTYKTLLSNINTSLANMLYRDVLIDDTYQYTSWLDSDGNLKIKFCGNKTDEDKVYMFYVTYNVDNNSLSEIDTLKLSYNDKVVDWTYNSYKQMLNELYDYSYPIDDKTYTLEACNVYPYNSKYYMICAQQIVGNGEGGASEEEANSTVTPYVLFKSSDGITWEPIKNVVEFNGSGETEISIANDKILCILRNRRVGTYYFVCDLSGNILKDKSQLSDVASKPATFVWDNNQYVIYNISTSVPADERYYGRIKIQLAKLESSNELTNLKTYIDTSGYQYYHVDSCKNRLYFVNTADIAQSNFDNNAGPYCNLTFSEINVSDIIVSL